MKPQHTPKLRGKSDLVARRHFTRNLIAGTSLALALPLNSFAQTAKSNKGTQLDVSTLTEKTQLELKTQRRSTFKSVLSDYFQTTNGMGRRVSLLLLEINDLPEQRKLFSQQIISTARESELRENSFALVFRGPLGIPLQQNTYKLSHPVLGDLQIFLVPIGKVRKDAAGRDYEAVFNRMVE